MKINPLRAKFLDRFLEGDLSPKEELFALCNAYKKSKQMRAAAIYSETEKRFRHAIKDHKYYREAERRIRRMKNHPKEVFGDHLREYIYNRLIFADNFETQ